VTVSADFLTAADKAFIELKALRELTGVTDQQLKDFQARVDALEKQAELHLRLIDSQASESSELRLSLADQRKALLECKQALSSAVSEIEKLRKQRDAARRRTLKAGLVGVIVGAAAVIFLGGRL